MILAVSTSSPWLSLAVFSPGLETLAHRSEGVRNEGHRALHRLLDEAFEEAAGGAGHVTDLVVDVGPGGFTSVRIGVTFAKTFALITTCRLWSLASFDLFPAGPPAVVPSKRGEWFLREADGAPAVVRELPEDVVGYGFGGNREVFPDVRLAARREAWRPSDPMKLAPFYIGEPSISVPKTPYRRVGEASA